MKRLFAILAVMATMLGFATAAQASMRVNVDLANQRMQVTTSDGESHNWAISSGREGYRTIRGNFRPYRLEKKWYSRKYGGNMPNAVFFRGGFAVHGTGAVGMLGRPASHGCVRLHPANAAKFFALVQQHGKSATQIAIHGTAPDTGTRYAKAKNSDKNSKTQLAKAKVKAPSWDTARGQLMLRQGLPPTASGFVPLSSPYSFPGSQR